MVFSWLVFLRKVQKESIKRGWREKELLLKKKNIGGMLIRGIWILGRFILIGDLSGLSYLLTLLAKVVQLT